jgi:hypothetical protein
LFPQNRSKECRERRAKANKIARHRRRPAVAANPNMDAAIFAFVRARRELVEDLEEIERLFGDDRRTGIEPADVAELVDDRDNPSASLFRLFDHFPLAIARRRLVVAVEHAEVAEND